METLSVRELIKWELISRSKPLSVVVLILEGIEYSDDTKSGGCWT